MRPTKRVFFLANLPIDCSLFMSIEELVLEIGCCRIVFLYCCLFYNLGLSLFLNQNNLLYLHAIQLHNMMAHNSRLSAKV
jgi:hypothetical protein